MSSWNNENKKDYIKSTLVGTVSNFIQLVMLTLTSLLYNEGGIDDDSYEYFKQLSLEEFKYLSIDGNNRSIALKILEIMNLKCIKENIMIHQRYYFKICYIQNDIFKQIERNF